MGFHSLFFQQNARVPRASDSEPVQHAASLLLSRRTKCFSHMPVNGAKMPLFWRGRVGRSPVCALTSAAGDEMVLRGCGEITPIPLET